MRILLASPAYWPARAFGGPVVVARELVRRLVDRGYEIDVLTTTIQDQQSRPSGHTSVATVDGARVYALGTPLHYRWMGITPTLPWWLTGLPRDRHGCSGGRMRVEYRGGRRDRGRRAGRAHRNPRQRLPRSRRDADS